MAVAVNPGTQEVLREFRERVGEIYGERLLQVILFGSEARGDVGPESDIDIVLIFRDDVAPGQEITRLGPLLADLNLRFERLVSVIPLSMTQYETVDEPFLRQVRREGIAVRTRAAGSIRRHRIRRATFRQANPDMNRAS